MSVMERRIAAAQLVGKLLATTEGRKYFAENGFKSGQAIVTADYDEQIKDVLPRIHGYTPPVTIALIKGEELFLFNIEPELGVAERAQSSKASPESTMGMLYEASRQLSHGTTFQLSSWDRAATATSMPSVRELLAL